MVGGVGRWGGGKWWAEWERAAEMGGPSEERDGGEVSAAEVVGGSTVRSHRPIVGRGRERGPFTSVVAGGLVASVDPVVPVREATPARLVEKRGGLSCLPLL